MKARKMLDIQLLRGDTAAVAARLAQRGFAFDTARFETLENRRKDLQVKTEELQAFPNKSARSKARANTTKRRKR